MRTAKRLMLLSLALLFFSTCQPLASSLRRRGTQHVFIGAKMAALLVMMWAAYAYVKSLPPLPRTNRYGTKLMLLTILPREFSYEAFGPSYRSSDIRLGGHRPGGEFETFYSILAGDLPTETRSHWRSRDDSKGNANG